MINDLDMQGWAYLLAPTFQFVNTAGKPLTEGYLEVYIAGTRNKYYCASDFNGTLHPFQIPLDSLGSNIVLADPSQAYDVYAYNRFGSLVMSRYNVSPSNAGGSGVLTITISSNDDTVQVVKDGNNYDLSIADTIARIDDIEDRLDNIGDGSVGYAVAHSELASGGLFELTNDKNKDIDYTGDMHGFRLKPGHVYQLNFNAKFDCNNDTNDLISGKFYLDGDNVVAQEWQFNVDNSFEHQESFNGSTVLVIPEDVSYYDVKLKYSFDDEALDLYLNKISIVDVTSIVSQGASGKGVYTEGDGIIIVDNSISVDMDYINEHLEIDASSILSSAYNYTDARVSQASGDLINIIAEATGNIPMPEQVQVDWNQDDDTQVDYIKNKPDLDIYATHDELETTVTNVVSSVSSVIQNEIDNIPTQVQSDWEESNTSSPAYIQHKPEVEEVEFEEINLDDYALASAIQDISNLATKDELNVASGNIINYVDNSIDNVTNVIESVSGDLQEQINNIPAQVQSDWDEDDVDSPAYIDNKPDLSIYATETQLETVSGDIVAMIPDPQIQSDWTQTDNTQVDYIKNKPEEEEVDFEEINLNDYALASAIPSIEGLATVAQVSSVSSVLQNEIDNIPEQVNADWNSNSGKSEILNKPDLSIYATHNEVSGVSGNIINYVNEQISEIPEQVQSDWAETDSQDLAYIKNKPTERQLIPGDNISITASGNNFVISAEGEVSLEDLATVSGNIIAQIPDAQVQANWNESDNTQPSYIQNKPDLSIFATIDDVNSVTSLIPEAQVQSDWTEDDTTDPSYILNKPNELELVAGNNIEIAVSGTNIVISSTASAVTGLDLLYGQFTSNNVSTTATMAKSKGNINVSDGKIQLEQGKSYHITVRGYYQQTNAANSYSPISYVEYITSKSINIDIDRSRTDAQYFELSYDLFNLNSDIDYQVAFSGGAGLVKDLIVEVHSLGGAGTGSSSGGSAIEYDAGYGINIANQVISVDSSIIPDTSTLATKAEVANVSGTIVGMIPNTSNLATKAELNSASANIIGQIPEVPESANLIAGNNITITASGNDYVISSTASGGESGESYTAGNGLNLVGNEFSIDTSVVATQSDLSAVETEVQAVSSAIPTLPQEEEVEFEEIDLSNYALASAIPDVSNLATKGEVANVEADVQVVSAAIPQSSNLIPGDNITITASGDDYVISSTGGGAGTTYTAGDYIDITNNVISVDTSDVVDIVPGSNVTITVSGSSAIISSTGEPQVQSDWNVSDSSSKAYIKNKPTIPAAQVQSNWNETNTSSKAYIKNKPTIHTYTGASGVNIANDVVSLDNPIGLVAGENITITVSGDSAIIAGQAGGGSNNNYVKVITDSSSTSQVTYGDLRALCEGHAEFDLFYDATLSYHRYIYRCSRAKEVGSHYEVCFTTVPVSDEYEQGEYVNGKHSNIVFEIYFWFWKVSDGGPSDDTIAYVGSDIVPGVNTHNYSYRSIQADWNETDTAAQTYIKNKPTGLVTYSGNTAINHIQLVSSLPASPDANTLYLIPEV